MKNKYFKLLMLLLVLSTSYTSCDKIGDDDDPDNNSLITGTFTDQRDNKTYNWVQIGTQVWMAENLAYKVDTGGCWAYDDTEANVATYGYLYNYWTAEAVVPAGWHLPTDQEWNTLTSYLSANGYSIEGTSNGVGIAKALASKTEWVSSDEKGAVGNTDYEELRNKTGFSAYPAGQSDDYNGDITYLGLGASTVWWSKGILSNGYPQAQTISFSQTNMVRLNAASLTNGYSIRCIRN